MSTAAMVERVADRLSIPFTVGGGIRTAEDMRDILRAGADEVAVNTAAVEDPAILSNGARRFGRQSVVLAIDARRRGHGTIVGINGSMVNGTPVDEIEAVGRQRQRRERRGVLERPDRAVLAAPDDCRRVDVNPVEPRGRGQIGEPTEDAGRAAGPVED
jgi:imidazole glycerol phosphate synthase subunit HisF